MKENIIEIKKEILFAGFSIKKNLSSAVELRSSFVFSVIGMAINNLAFIVMWMAFGVIAKDLGGWQPIDVIGMNAFVAIGFGLSFSFFAGLREIPEIVTTGSLDKFLLSPKNALLRISTSSFSASAVGDLLFGLVAMVIWFYFIHVNFIQLLFALVFCICAALIFFFFNVFANAIAFYFADARSVVNSLFELLLTPALFYGGAFQGLLRFFFIFIVPSILLGTFPVEVVKSESYLKLLFTVFLTIAWICTSLFVFRKAVAKYESTNFINFG